MAGQLLLASFHVGVGSRGRESRHLPWFLCSVRKTDQVVALTSSQAAGTSRPTESRAGAPHIGFANFFVF